MSTYISNAPQNELRTTDYNNGPSEPTICLVTTSVTTQSTGQHSGLSSTPTKRNKRKNFKPRCSNVPDDDEEADAEDEGVAHDAKRPRNDASEFDNDNEFNSDSENSEPDVQNSTSNNNHLKLVRRRKTTHITRRVFSNYYDKNSSALNLSSKSDNDDCSDNDELSTVNKTSRSQFTSIDHLSKSASAGTHHSHSIWPLVEHSKMYDESHETSTAHLQIRPPPPNCNNASEIRDFAVKTVRELLGIYGLTSEAESISKQLPIGVFQGNILETANLTNRAPLPLQQFPLGGVSLHQQRIVRTNSPLSQPPTPPRTPYSPDNKSICLDHHNTEQSDIAQLRLSSTSPARDSNTSTNDYPNHTSTPSNNNTISGSVNTAGAQKPQRPSFQSEFEKVYTQKLSSQRNEKVRSTSPVTSMTSSCASIMQNIPQNLTVSKQTIVQNQQQSKTFLNNNNTINHTQQSTLSNNNVSLIQCYSAENSNSNLEMEQIRQKLADLKTPRGIYPSSNNNSTEILISTNPSQSNSPIQDNKYVQQSSSQNNRDSFSNHGSPSNMSSSGGGQKSSSSQNLQNLDYSRYVKKYGTSMECGNIYCKELNLREHFHCLDCVESDHMNSGSKVFAKKEEMIRHWKWHKKREESLQHGFMRYSPLDDCSVSYASCQHNRRQTHYHCIHNKCDKVYISTSDVQMHANYHRKDSAIIQEGFQRFRATEDCDAPFCVFFGQRTTHFHCRRDGCRYTFKNKADMEKHKSYHIKDEQLSRDGFKKFMKAEACPFEHCRFSKVCNHIHCIRAQCTYVLHSSGQLYSHKRKHERKDSELAYRKFKLAQSMLKNFTGLQAGNLTENLPQQIQDILKNYAQSNTQDILPSNIHDIISYYQNNGDCPMPTHIQELIKAHQNYEAAAQNLSRTDPELFRSYEQSLDTSNAASPSNNFDTFQSYANSVEILGQYIQELMKSYENNFDSMPTHVQELIKKYQSMLQMTSNDATQLDQLNNYAETQQMFDMISNRSDSTPLNLSEQNTPLTFNDTIKIYQDNLIMKQERRNRASSGDSPIPACSQSPKKDSDNGQLKLTEDQIEQIEHLKRLGINLTIDQINGHLDKQKKIPNTNVTVSEVKMDNDDKETMSVSYTNDFSDDESNHSTDSNSLAIDLSGAHSNGPNMDGPTPNDEMFVDEDPKNDTDIDLTKKINENAVDWNNEDFWLKYGKFVTSRDVNCPRDNNLKCELSGKDHYHCLVENCGMIFNCKDGVREHARNHEQENQVSEHYYTCIKENETCSIENCAYDTKERHYHCNWDNCREVILLSDKIFRRLEHFKMHEYSRKLSLTKDPLTMTHLATSIEGMFRRKRGRPPKNRVIEVWNDYTPVGSSSFMDSPQAIFTSFKLPKPSTSVITNTNMSQTTTKFDSQDDQVISPERSASNSPISITAQDIIPNDYRFQGFDVYDENDTCSDQYCMFASEKIHFHCNKPRCYYSTNTPDLLLMHSKDFHDNIEILEGFVFFDRNVDCRLPECLSNKVNRHFHCVRSGCKYTFVRYSAMSAHYEKHMHPESTAIQNSQNAINEVQNASTNVDASTSMQKAQMNSSSGGGGYTINVKKEFQNEDISCHARESHSPKGVSVVKASGTFYPLSALPSSKTTHEPNTSKRLQFPENTPENLPTAPIKPATPVTNDSPQHTLYGPDLSCSRPFCKLKRKHHYHCNVCNQAFSELDRLVTHISKHSNGVLNAQINPPLENNNMPTIPISSSGTIERKSPIITVTPIQNLQNPNFVSSFTSTGSGVITSTSSTNPTGDSEQIKTIMHGGSSPGAPIPSPTSSSYADYVAAHHATLTAQLISQQSGIPLQYLYHNPSLIYQIHQHGLQIMQQQSALTSPTVVPPHSGLNISNSSAYQSGGDISGGPTATSPTSTTGSLTPLALMAANLTKRAISPSNLSTDSSEQKKARIQNSMRILKDEPVPEGYLRFRFNEDCQYPHCGYREHQTHFHCQRQDCGYSFCDKTRFVQHTARHERLDTLMGGDFQQYRANFQCRRQDCAYTNTLGHTQNKASHFHCLKCDFVCTDTNKVVAHRRQHQKLDSIQAAGFEKFTPSQQCSGASTGCQHSGRQTHYHCLSCQYAVLGLAQMSAHKYRHLEG